MIRMSRIEEALSACERCTRSAFVVKPNKSKYHFELVTKQNCTYKRKSNISLHIVKNPFVLSVSPVGIKMLINARSSAIANSWNAVNGNRRKSKRNLFSRP